MSKISPLKCVDKVSCGYDQWAIGVGPRGEVMITLDRLPVYGEMLLQDASVDELRALGEMFLARARELSK